jgi:hypothetical protein
MKLDILTKQRIDKWFSEVTADELLYITKKYLTQDQSLQLIQPVVVGQSEQLVCDLCEGTGLNDRYTVQEDCHLCQGSGEAN